MAISPDLMDSFNDCIDLLNQGQSVDSVLGQFPAQADQLRPMLEAGLLLPRVRFPVGDVNVAQARVEPTVQQAAEAVFRSGLWGSWPILLAVMIIGGGILLAIISNQPDHVLIPPTETSLPTITHTPSPTTTATATPSATPSPTNTALPATPTPVAEVVQTADAPPPLIVIEGPVEDMTDNTITVFDTIIEVEPDNPLLDAITIGDVVRVEGDYITRDAIIVLNAVTITFVEIDVYVDEGNGTVWREDNASCANPPPPWAPAHGWRRRCEGNGEASDSDDDDDD